MYAVAEKKENQTGWQLGNPIGNAPLYRRRAAPVPTPQGTDARRSSCVVVMHRRKRYLREPRLDVGGR